MVSELLTFFQKHFKSPKSNEAKDHFFYSKEKMIKCLPFLRTQSLGVQINTHLMTWKWYLWINCQHFLNISNRSRHQQAFNIYHHSKSVPVFWWGKSPPSVCVQETSSLGSPSLSLLHITKVGQWDVLWRLQILGILSRCFSLVFSFLSAASVSFHEFYMFLKPPNLCLSMLTGVARRPSCF